jgi:hypothetical protein
VHTYRLRGCGQLEVHVRGQGAAAASAAPPAAAAAGSGAGQQPQQPQPAAALHHLCSKLRAGGFYVPVEVMRGAFSHESSFPLPLRARVLVDGRQLGHEPAAVELTQQPQYRLGVFEGHKHFLRGCAELLAPYSGCAVLTGLERQGQLLVLHVSTQQLDQDRWQLQQPAAPQQQADQQLSPPPPATPAQQRQQQAQQQQPPRQQPASCCTALHTSTFYVPIHVIRTTFSHVTSFPHTVQLKILVNGQQLGSGTVESRIALTVVAKTGQRQHRLGGATLVAALGGLQDPLLTAIELQGQLVVLHVVSEEATPRREPPEQQQQQQQRAHPRQVCVRPVQYHIRMPNSFAAKHFPKLPLEVAADVFVDGEPLRLGLPVRLAPLRRLKPDGTSTIRGCCVQRVVPLLDAYPDPAVTAFEVAPSGRLVLRCCSQAPTQRSPHKRGLQEGPGEAAAGEAAGQRQGGAGLQQGPAAGGSDSSSKKARTAGDNPAAPQQQQQPEPFKPISRCIKLNIQPIQCLYGVPAAFCRSHFGHVSTWPHSVAADVQLDGALIAQGVQLRLHQHANRTAELVRYRLSGITSLPALGGRRPLMTRLHLLKSGTLLVGLGSSQVPESAPAAAAAAPRSGSSRRKARPRKSQPRHLHAAAATAQLLAPEGPQDCSGCYPLPLTCGAFLFPAQLLQQCAGPGSSGPPPWRLDVLLDLTVDGALVLHMDDGSEVVQALVQRAALQAGCPRWRQLAAAGGGGGDDEPALFCLAGLCEVFDGLVRPRVVRYEVLRAAGPGAGQPAHVGVWVETDGEGA